MIFSDTKIIKSNYDSSFSGDCKSCRCDCDCKEDGSCNGACKCYELDEQEKYVRNIYEQQ